MQVNQVPFLNDLNKTFLSSSIEFIFYISIYRFYKFMYSYIQFSNRRVLLIYVCVYKTAYFSLLINKDHLVRKNFCIAVKAEI